MNPFDYIRVRTVEDAIAAAALPGAAYLAGGTNLVDLMKSGAARPARLVDIGRIEGLDTVEMTPDGGARIGALARNADISRDARFAAAFPLVAEALRSGASQQLRNAATLGGNLLQRTRCAYFFDPGSACNKRESNAGCAAIGGETRGHAILGFSNHCIATHASDLCVALAALDARVEIAGPAGRREVAFDDFYLKPGNHPERETTLQPGELIVAIALPASAAAFRGHARYLKLRDRASYAFALVSAAAAMQIDGGKITEARIALGGVAPKPWRAREAEAALAGAAPSAEAFATAAAAALQDARPSGDNAFKIELARRTVARALRLALEGTPATSPALPASPFGVA